MPTLTIDYRDDAAGDDQLRDAGRVSYVRLRRSRYDAAALARWADRLTALGVPSYVYFRHDGDPGEAVRLFEAVRG